MLISGGWLLVFNIVISTENPSPTLSLETSYHRIVSYGSNNLVLMNSAINELREHLSFTQLRFHCSKQQGRTFHVTTAANSSGEAVVQYFSGQTENIPHSCGSFLPEKGDNSYLAGQCNKWGYESGHYFVGKWGHEGKRELHDVPVFKAGEHHWVTHRRWDCNDFNEFDVPSSAGDYWKIFVR